MLLPIRCPACLSHSTCSVSGNEFSECTVCNTIFSRNRRTTARYDAAYVAARYDRYGTTAKMSRLRLEVLEGVLRLHESLNRGSVVVERGRLLDVGYGNGDFIRTARAGGWDAWGNDVNPTAYEGVRPANLPNVPDWPIRYRVITFFDSLEHFEDTLFARWASHAADWLLLSFPKRPDSFPFDLSWKHYRPGEHHLYFTAKGLETIFSHHGVKAEVVYQGHPEDWIRKPLSNGDPNIQTVALRCRRE